MIIELTPRNVEVVCGDLHQGLSVDCHWHTQDEVLNLLTFILYLMLMHDLTIN